MNKVNEAWERMVARAKKAVQRRTIDLTVKFKEGTKPIY